MLNDIAVAIIRNKYTVQLDYSIKILNHVQLKITLPVLKIHVIDKRKFTAYNIFQIFKKNLLDKAIFSMEVFKHLSK